MKKKHLYTIIAFVILLGVCFTYNYYAAPKLRQPYKLIIQEDTFRIAYIGDSWAFFHRNHECKIANMLKDIINRPVKVHTYGICGLTSKEIYKQFYDNNDFKNYIQKRRYEVCFVSAGINDTYKKMSTNYYKKSMNGIIQFLLTNHILPVILEIPDYNIVKAYNRQPIHKKLIRRLSMFVSGCDIDCKQDFRQALDELIQENGYQDSIRIIRYKSWNSNYYKDLQNLYWEEGMHLNEEGYIVLDSMIVNSICKSSLVLHNNTSQME